MRTATAHTMVSRPMPAASSTTNMTTTTTKLMTAQTPSHPSHPSHPSTAHPSQAHIPSIRLIAATPSASGNSTPDSSSNSANISSTSTSAVDASWGSIPPMPSPLAPRVGDTPGRKKLVPKRSKLSLLGVGIGSADKAAAKDAKAGKEAKAGKDVKVGKEAKTAKPPKASLKAKKSADFSDITRRLGVPSSSSSTPFSSVRARGGFEIYVDPAYEESVGREEMGGEMGEEETVDIEQMEVGEIVVVKKKKSRMGLDGMRWGAASGASAANGASQGSSGAPLHNALEEVTNVPKYAANLPMTQTMRLRAEENGKGENAKEGKWWSIGRGRKGSEGKDGKEKDAKVKSRAKSPGPAPTFAQASTVYVPPRSMTPDPFKPASSESRARFNSLNSATLLNSSTANSSPNIYSENAARRETTGFVAPPNTISMSSSPYASMQRSQTSPFAQTPPHSAPPQSQMYDPPTFSRSHTLSGGLLAPPSSSHGPQASQAQDSIALRAIRSVRSMARIFGGDEEASGGKKEKEATVGRKEGKKSKDATVGKKEGKTKKSDEGIIGKTKKPKAEKKSKKADTLRASSLSTSSFEVGAASPQPQKTLVRKKRSILGLGLPSSMSMRLPNVRSGSTQSNASAASSIGAEAIASYLAAGPGGGSAAGAAAPATVSSSANRLSVDSATMLGRGRSGSVMSTNSSLRPLSTTSSMSSASRDSRESRVSSGSSAASVRWDEKGLESVKELRRREKEERRREVEEGRDKEGREDETEEERKERERKEKRESRRSSEGRKRTPLSEVFPDVHAKGTSASQSPQSVRGYPIVTVEEATCDGHGAPDDVLSLNESNDSQVGTPLATPIKKARARPVSEQMLGKSRPKGIHEEGGEGVISMLDAATNDLALLINTLDLEATPNTPDLTPLRPLVAQLNELSPTKKTLRHNVSSNSSLRPYAQSRRNQIANDFIGQQIAPWPTLRSLAAVSEATPLPVAAAAAGTPPTAKSRLSSHQRTLTPGPDPEPSPVLQALRPAKWRVASGNLAPRQAAVPDSPSPSPTVGRGTLRASLLTFGSRGSSRAGSQGSLDDFRSSVSPSPVFTTARGHTRKRSSLGSGDRSSQGSSMSETSSKAPLAPNAKRMLGMRGTMGASDGSAYQDAELDASDPDSDIPDELQVILKSDPNARAGFAGGDIEDTLSYSRPMSPPPTTSLPQLPHATAEVSDDEPPMLDLPIFRAQLIDEEDNHGDIDEGMHSSEEDTKKSFDFTGELQKLNESGASDRRSFVEQLETAFRTPAKIDLRYDFGGALLQIEVPPVPPLPVTFSREGMMQEGSSGESSSFDEYEVSRIGDVKEPTLLRDESTNQAEHGSGGFDMYSESQILDAKEPTMLPGSDSLALSEESEDLVDDSPRALRPATSASSRPSNGQLNKAFKFGGKPTAPPVESNQPSKPLTLADIIPPPAHARSLSLSSLEEDDSVMNSILAKATDIHVRPRLDSDSSSKRRARDASGTATSSYRHSRHSSGMSFAGLESFEEVRRGFEFHDNRPPFYPPPASRRAAHGRQESLFSIASVSSYGHVTNPGIPDPFDYGLSSLRERPSSEDLSVSMSMTVDDTFSFLDRQPRRRRVDSDSSSFYFKPAGQSFTRGHNRRESNMSVISQAPPISLYNRSFAVHRRNDSNTSASSVAQSYAMHGAAGARASWARHRQDPSVDSLMSDYSAMRLGRPGIGDKMFDTSAAGGDFAMPLMSISASPPESVMASRFGNRDSFDSILDEDRRSSMDDSLFDQTGHRSSMSSDSVFGYDFTRPQGHLVPPSHHQFRPLSSLSVNSVHSPMKEDDTMISMLGGGHVRRRSIGSVFEASPCVRVEKRKHDHHPAHPVGDHDYHDSNKKVRIVEKASIASTIASKFGGERMIKAQRGILERQSLEESCLIAAGEDLSTSLRSIPVFSKPGPASRSRSSTCTSSSSGGDTPPLSAASDGFSSMSEGGSQSSIDIDLSHVNMVLNSTHPAMTSSGRNRVRARARGHGHRRRVSQAHASRSSVYETIEEEVSSPDRSLSSSLNSSTNSKKTTTHDSPTACQPIYIVDPDTMMSDARSSMTEESFYDDERGIVALRRYFDLRNEAEHAVTESKRTWMDTPFSIFALQSFQPPRHPTGMQALLEHSVQNYGPLPSDLRPRRVRSRTQSRPSPYPQGRVMISPAASDHSSRLQSVSPELQRTFFPPNPTPGKAAPLQELRRDPNVVMSAAPSLEALKPFSPLVVHDAGSKRENAYGLANDKRQRVGSTARRTALGWSKRSTGPGGKTSSDLKENTVNTSQGMIMMTPGETLRINRPRPRGRPTPARPLPGSVRQVRV